MEQQVGLIGSFEFIKATLMTFTIQSDAKMKTWTYSDINISQLEGFKLV